MPVTKPQSTDLTTSQPNKPRLSRLARAKARLRKLSLKAPLRDDDLLVGTIYDEHGKYDIRPDNFASREEHLRRLQLHEINFYADWITLIGRPEHREYAKSTKGRERIKDCQQHIAILKRGLRVVVVDDDYQLLLPDPRNYTREQWDHEVYPDTRTITIEEYDRLDREFSYEIRGFPAEKYPPGYNNRKPLNRECIRDRAERLNLFRTSPRSKPKITDK